jgi:hypothetical protein
MKNSNFPNAGDEKTVSQIQPSNATKLLIRSKNSFLCVSNINEIPDIATHTDKNVMQNL